MLQTFQISLTILVILTGIILAVAEGSPLPALCGPLALATYFFVDREQRLVLPQWMLTAMGAVAFLLAGLEYMLMPMDSPLIAGGRLLVYLTAIYLIHPKELRQYWGILALSILQIALASMLTSSMWFGWALLVYALLAMWTLSTFLLNRCVRSLGDSALAPAGINRDNVDIDHQTPKIWNGYSSDHRERLINHRFVMSTLTVACLSLVLSVLFFLFTPRVWSSPRVSTETGLKDEPLTGFTEEVRLGDMGEILESADNVLTLKVYDLETGEQIQSEALGQFLGAEPLLRGAVLEVYEYGRWHRQQSKSARDAAEFADEATIRLEFELQPMGSETLFAFGNLIGAQSGPLRNAVRWEYFSNELRRGRTTSPDMPFQYSVYTDRNPPDTWAAERRLRSFSNPWVTGPNGFRRTRFTKETFHRYLKSLLRIPLELEPVTTLAQELTAEATTPTEAAEALENWFLFSGQFDYSLKMHVADSSIDPIVDFVINRRSGHCEYFASALAMMLRGLNIPSRVITGFKGGVINAERHEFTVQQLHAHAWVEAFLDDRWVIFDPTPAERNESVATRQSPPSRWRQFWLGMENRWSTAMRLNRTDQQALLYSPIRKNFEATLAAARELLQGKTSRIRSLIRFLSTPRLWFSWQGGVIAMILLTALAGCAWLAKRILFGLLALRKIFKEQQSRADRLRRQVSFYERFLRIVARLGIRQQPTQTAREFVRDSLERLQPQLAAANMGAWPDEMVDVFYRVRFGNAVLNPQEAEALDTRLSQLENTLQNPAAKSS